VEKKLVKEKTQWKQQRFSFKSSPFSFVYSIRNRLHLLQKSLKYDAFWISWQGWWIIAFGVYQSIFFYLWLNEQWQSIREKIPIWYGTHNLQSLLDRKEMLLFPIIVSVVTIPLLLILIKKSSKEFWSALNILVILQVLMFLLSFIAISKIITI